MTFGEPKYVTKIIPETNTVVLGDVDDLLKNGLTVGKLNWQKYNGLTETIEAVTQIRYNSPGTLSEISLRDGIVDVNFFANVKGIAPGQSAVFYEGDDVIGGGIIRRDAF